MGIFYFNCAHTKPEPETVKDLIELLKQLPADMDIGNRDGSRLSITVEDTEAVGEGLESKMLIFERDGE